MQSVEIASEAALLVIRSGGSTVAAERSFTNILKGFGEKAVATVWRLDFVVTTYAVKGQLCTVVQPVGPIGVNLGRASAMAILGERVARGEVGTNGLRAELEHVKHLPSPYNRWVLVVIAAFTGACFSQIPGGDWGSLGIAFVAAGAGQCLRWVLQAKRLGIAPVTFIAGTLSACIAALGVRLGFSQVESATMLASVIYLVPGLPLINGFVDIMSHKYLLVGIERVLNAGYLFLVLALAIAFAHTCIV